MPVKEIRLKCILSVAQANKMQRLINADKSNVISDDWLANEAEITVFVGTRHNKDLGSRPVHHGYKCRGI